MSEDIKMGLGEKEITDVIGKVFSGAKKETTKTFVYKAKSDGVKELTKEIEDLVEVMSEAKNLNQSQRGVIKLFGGQEKIINNLKKNWNEYVTAVKNGSIDSDGNITITSSQNRKEYNKINRIRGDFLRSASVAKTVFGDDYLSKIVDGSGVDQSVIEEMKSTIQKLLSTESFKNFSQSPEKIAPVLEFLDRVEEKAKAAGMSLEQAFEFVNQNVDGFKDLNIDYKDVSQFELVSEVMRLVAQEAENAAKQQQNNASAEEEAAGQAEESARRTEEAVERETKAYENLEQIRNRAVKNKKEKHTFDDNNQFNQEMYWDKDTDHDVKIESDDIKSYQDALERLNALQQEALRSAQEYQNAYAKAYNRGDDLEANEHLQNMQRQIDYYNEYSDAIDYVQKQLTEATMNFKPGDSWGEDEIGVTIKLLQDLTEQINTIKESFSTIKSPEEFQVLITSIESVSEKLRELTSSFNTAFTSFDDNGEIISITNYFEKLISTIDELQKTMSQLDMNFSVKFGGNSNTKSPLEMADERRREQEAIYDKLLQERSEIEARIYGKYKSAQSPTQMIMSLFGNRKTPGLQNYTEWAAFAEEYSSQAIESQFKKSMSGANSSLRRYIQKIISGANLAGIDVSDIVSKYQPKDVDTDKSVSDINNLADAEDKAKNASEQMSEALSKLIKTTDLSPIIEQLNTISKAMQQMVNVLEESSKTLGALFNFDSIGNFVGDLQSVNKEISDIDDKIRELKDIEDDLNKPLYNNDIHGETPYDYGYVDDDPDAIRNEISKLQEQKEELLIYRSNLLYDISQNQNGNFSALFGDNIANQISDIPIALQTLRDSLSGLSDLFKQTFESFKVPTSEIEKLNSVNDAIKSEGEAAATATPLKEAMTNANKELADSADKTADSAKSAANGIEEEGNASKNSQDKNIDDTKYDDEKMKARAKSIDDAAKKMQSDFESQGLVASIQRMYDSHDNLVQAIVTSKKQIQDEDGRLAEQVEHFNIHWDKKGDELYTARMTKDDYEKYNGASDQDALIAAQKESEYQAQREAEYRKQRADEIAKGREQEKEQNIRDREWAKMEEDREKDINEMAQRREDAELRRRQEQDKIAREQAAAINKNQEKEYLRQQREQEKEQVKMEKEQERERKKQEKAQLEQEKLNSPEYRYNTALDKIKALGEANTNVLNLKAKQVQGVDVTDQMADALENLKQKAKEAKEALDELRKAKDIPIGKIDEAKKLYNSDDIQIGSAQSRDRYRQAAFKKNENNLNKQNAKEYKEDISIINEYIQKQKELNDLRIDSVKSNLSEEQLQRKDALESETQAADLAKQAYDRLNAARDAGNMTETQLSQFKKVSESYNDINNQLQISTKYGKTRDSLFSNIESKLSKAVNGDRQNGGWRPEGWSDEIIKLQQRIKELKDQASNIDIGDPDAAERFKEIREQIQQVQADYTNLSKSEQWKPIDTTWQDSFTNKVAKWAEQNKIAAKEFREELEKIREDAKGIDNEFDAAQLENRFSRVQTEAADRNLLGKSLGDRFKDQFKNTMTSLATYYLSFQDFIRYGREAIQVVTELDTAMMELKKVSNESAQSYSTFLKNSFDQADMVGGNAKQIIESAAAWKRLGKSFEESQQAAQASVKLLNVSEFESIDDATTSLISMRQAFKDNTYDDFIDKLNGVGDSFSSSTDQIAYGMRNVSAVLKVAGNDIDQSIALLTAANDITQDMSKASMGVRTIALRISGTQEAKQELEDLGEDVSDFVVQTQSKVDAQVRKYTATAANPNGISVLDETGRLRDTYDILLDISRVYQDIVDKDNQMGTNTSNALLELLAGKTRSNILASILQNPTLLEEAYETSKNSQGVGQRELDIYLDSIEAKTAKLQNRLQELASTAIDSEFIKTVIEGLTKILELANSLVDTFGTLPTILGTVGGFFLQRNGFGILAKDKNTKQFGLGFAQKIKEGLSSGLTKVSFSDELNNIFKGVDPSTVINKDWVKSMGGFDKLPQALQQYIQDCNEAGQSTITLGGAMGALGEKTSGLSTAFSGLASIGLDALSTLGTMALTMVASMAIQAAIKGIYDLIHADEIAIEKGKEAQESITDITNSYNEQQKSLSDIQKEYAQLSTGVDVSNGRVKNRNLSEDEFGRYLEISQQIAEIAPELVTGYDAQGNAIVNLGNTVDGVNEKFEEYLKLQRDIANAEIGSSLDTVWTGLEKEAKSYKDQLESLQITQISAADEHAKSINAIGQHGEKQEQINNETITITVDTDDAKRIHDLLYENDLWRSEYDTGAGTTEFSVDLGTADEKILNTLNTYFEKSELEGSVVTNLAEAQQKKTQLLLDQTYQKAIPSIQEYIRTNSIFDNIENSSLSESMRNGLSDMMSRIDYKSVVEDIDNAGGLENWLDGIIATMSIDDSQVQQAFDELFKLEEKRDNMQLSEYLQRRNELYQQLENKFGEDYLSNEQLAIMFGNATRDEEGNYHDLISDRISSAESKLGFGGDLNFYRQFSTAPLKYAESALSAIESMPQKQAEKIAGNWDAFWEYIEPYLTGENIKSEASTDTLSTLLNDESYKELAEKSASNLSSLTGALETLRTEGSLTAEEMVNLQNSFPDLTEFTTEAIQTKAFEELDEWIGKIREGMKGMSDEGKEQAQTMIQNMVDQYGDLGLSYQDVKNAYWDLNGHSEMKGRTGLFDAQVEELRSRLESEGLELDTHVLYTLVASDQFSGDADEIYNKYNDAKLNWQIELDKQKLEEEINKAQNRIENSESSRELKEANGEVITSADYAYDLIEKRRIAKMRRDAADDAKDRYNKAIGPERAKYLQDMLTADTEANKAEADLVNTEIEAAKANANEDLQKLESSNTELSRIQNQISEAEKDGGKASAEMYEKLASEQENQSVINKTLGDYFQGLADNTDGEDNPVLKTQFQKEANDYYAAALQNEADAMESRNNPTLEEYNKLQTQSEQIQREITKAEQNHQKVSEKTYDDLINNGKAQIRNLQKQQSEVDKYSDKWWDLQNSIDSMSDSIYEWDTTSKSLIYDQASQLASAISSAMSESISETGLTDDTINALKTAFSDLDGSKFDVSDAFYSTADGVKVNTEALQELTEAEFELIGAPLANEIANVQAQLEKDPGNSALQDKLENLMETNAKYFAQYEEMQKALSRNAAMDLAESTSNAGANYDANYERSKKYKEAYEKGLTGTDDFKAFTAYADVYGRDTIEAYEAVSSKIERYFTEDAADGLSNFLTDMEKLGYAAQDADGYWTITADDYDAAAKDMQMGSEWFMDTMHKLEDFGFIHTHVDSLNEAQLKTRDVEEQIADAVQTYSEMVTRGASDEELQKQIDHINELESQWQDLDTVTKTWAETTEANRRKEFLGLDDQLAAFEEMYKNADTDAGRDAARKAAEDYVKQFGYTLEEGKFKLSADDLVDYESRITTFSGSMENPLTAEDMGISEENVKRFDEMKNWIQELAQSGDLTSIQDSLSGITAEQLRSIDYDDGKYTEGFEAAEGAVDKLRKQLGLGVEDTDLLIDAMTALGLVVDQKVDVPTKFDTLDNFLANATKGSGAGYQISTDISRLSTDELQTQLSEISTLEVQIDPDSDVYNQLQELKKQTEIQLNIKNSDQTQTQLKEWAEAGDRENIAKTFGIDVNSEEVDKYIEQINNMPSDYDLAIHIDDSQFQTLIESITGKSYQAEVEVVGKDKVTSLVNKLQQKLQSNPITQPIIQKVQQFGQKIKEKVQATVGADTSNADKGTEKVESNLNQVNKSSATAQIRVNTDNAMSGIGRVRSALSNLSSYVSTPRINVIADGASLVIAQIKQAIDNLRDKTVTLTTKKVTQTGPAAIGTAHSLGTTSLSRAYAGGKDWTVGQDESALVNEIGQESIVRDGVWQLIPGGPHVEDLQKNDIIN